MAVTQERPVLPDMNLTREDEAELCLQHTGMPRGIAWVLCVTFLLVILAEPLVQMSLDLKRNSAARQRAQAAGQPLPPLRPQALDVVTLLPTWTQVREARGFWGYWSLLPPVPRIIEFEHALSQHSTTTQAILPVAQNLLTSVGAGNEKAYCGVKGWLFYRPDVDYLTSAGFLTHERLQKRARATTPVQPDPVKAVVQFREQLAERGIELVLLPMPSKSAIHPEAMTHTYRDFTAPLHNPSFAAFVKEVEQAGVHVLDVSPVLLRGKASGPQFLKTDTHWTPAGMENTATYVSAYLVQNRLLPPQGEARYARKSKRVTGTGDLVTMLKLPAQQRLFPPQTVETHPVVQADGTPWQSQRDAEILLLGDSYFNIYSLEGMGWGKGAGFTEQLSYLLQRPVDAITMNAGGSYATRQQLQKDLLRGRDRLAGKRVVLWEFAMRDLYEGDWKLFTLPKVAAPRATPVVKTPAPAFTLAIPEITNISAKTPTLQFGLTATVAASFTATVRDAANQEVRALATGPLTPGTAQQLTWDGTDAAGKPAAAGSYMLVVEGKTATGTAMAPVKSLVTIVAADAQPLRITRIAPATFDPTAGAKTTVTCALPTAGSYTLTVRDAAGKTVTTQTGSLVKAGTVRLTWTGLQAGKAVANGTYQLTVDGKDANGTAFTPATGRVTVQAKAPTAPIATPALTGLVIDGTIKTATKAPTPGSVPYKDCIIALEISVTKTVAGTLGDKDILVYVWGLRDNQTVNSSLTAGRTVRLKLTSWDTAERQYGAYNRVDPDDVNALLLPAYWGEVK